MSLRDELSSLDKYREIVEQQRRLYESQRAVSLVADVESSMAAHYLQQERDRDQAFLKTVGADLAGQAVRSLSEEAARIVEEDQRQRALLYEAVRGSSLDREVRRIQEGARQFEDLHAPVVRLGEEMAASNEMLRSAVDGAADPEVRAAIEDSLKVSQSAEMLFRSPSEETLAKVLGWGGPSLEETFRLLEEHNLDLASTYRAVTSNLLTGQASPLDQIAAGVAPGEVWRAARLTSVLAEPSAERAAEGTAPEPSTEELLARLRAEHPDLVRCAQGARLAYASDNPDRTRHVNVSLRALCDGLIWRLAPEDGVKAWTQKPEHFHKGRPTRRARVEFIVRSNPASLAARLLLSDAGFVKFLDKLQGPTHASHEFTSEQLLALIERGEGLVLTVLTLTSAIEN